MAGSAFILILTLDAERGAKLRDLLRQTRGHSCLAVATQSEAEDSIRRRAPDILVADRSATTPAGLQKLTDLLDSLSPDASLMISGGAEPDLPHSLNIRITQIDGERDPAGLVGPISEQARKAVARREDRLLKSSMKHAPAAHFEGIVGGSPAVQRIFERIRKAANNKLTVLILGETGTGKELIARAIHARSDRAKKEMKVVNCAGLSETLLESELFGHVRGAFTGAVTERKGYFVAADGGTLFLDEIGDMPMVMQAKLLRALEQREVTPVGSTEIRKVDVRVIAATNADLHKAMQERRFRDDLYYRLHQWEIRIPPLRERRQDIPLLVHHMLERASQTHNVNVHEVSSEAMELLTRYYWPGNVRELANVIESVACEVGNGRIDGDSLPESLRGSHELAPVSASGLVGLTMDQLEKMAIERTLRATQGNREQAAKMLDIGTRTLYRKIREYGL